jgi:hypothetical protein
MAGVYDIYVWMCMKSRHVVAALLLAQLPYYTGTRLSYITTKVATTINVVATLFG